MGLARRGYTLFAIALLGIFPCVYRFLSLEEGRVKHSLLVSALISWAGFLACRWLVPIAKDYTLRAGMFGYDINKAGTEAGEKRVPEALGLAAGVAYLVCIVFIQQLHYFDDALGSGMMPSGLDGSARGREWLVDYNAALATICFMLFLGFADDVLDLPWRGKLLLPAIASLPLLVAYSGGTGVSIPKPLRGILGLPDFLELGFLYKVREVPGPCFEASSSTFSMICGDNCRVFRLFRERPQWYFEEARLGQTRPTVSGSCGHK